MKEPVKRKVKFAVSKAYRATWDEYYKFNPNIIDNLTLFNRAKRKIPPERLPDKMQDHVLGGALQGIRECHLADDILLLYTHERDLVYLLLVCNHRDIKGPKAKEMAKRIKKLLKGN
jgi:mRNA interferase YafQ